MLAILLFLIFGFFILVFIVAIIIAPFKLLAAKPFKCPTCENDIKLIAKTGKCPNCKTKLYKHASGEFRVLA